MNRLFIGLIILFIVLPSTAQNEQYDINGWSIAAVPSAIINVWQGYQLKTEYGFNDNYGVNANLGYLYGKQNDGLYSGLRFRSSMRYYFNNSDREDDRVFMGIGYLHRRTTLKAQGDLVKFGGQFFERVRYKRKTALNGIFVMVGGKTKISEIFWMDSSFGLGLGRIVRSNEGLPEDAELRRDFDNIFGFSNVPGDYGFGIIIAHFSIGMRL